MISMDFPDPEGQRKYRCPEGHEWEASRVMRFWVSTEEPEGEFSTGPLCPYCIVRFFKNAFPALKTERSS